jgi:hypothetical protein
VLSGTPGNDIEESNLSSSAGTLTLRAVTLRYINYVPVLHLTLQLTISKPQCRDNLVQLTSARSILVLFSSISPDLRNGVSGMLRSVAAVFSLGFRPKFVYISEVQYAPYIDQALLIA